MIDKNAWFDRIDYKPGPGQARFHASDARIKTACCPRRAGKSHSAARDVEPFILMPNTRGWIVGPNYDLASKEFRYIWDDLVRDGRKHGLPAPIKKKDDIRSGNMYIRFPWGSEVLAKSCDKPSGLLGEELDWVIMAEAAQINNDVYERYVAPSLRVRRGRTVIATTPQMGADWVWRYYEAGQTSNDLGMESFNWGVSDNPMYPMDELENARKMAEKGLMSDEAFREQYLGEWVLYTGAVFKQFRPALHVIEPFAIPPHWKRMRAIDFGARDPFCCLWGAVSDTDDTVYIYREYYETGEPSTKQHAERIKESTGDEPIVWTVADKSGAQLRIDMASFGVATIPSDSGPHTKQVARSRISEYLTPNDKGRPKLFIFNTCVNLIREMRLLRWKESSQTDGAREHTVGDDHATDPLGYLLLKRPRPVQARKVIPFGSFDFWKKEARKKRQWEAMRING